MWKVAKIILNSRWSSRKRNSTNKAGTTFFGTCRPGIRYVGPPRPVKERSSKWTSSNFQCKKFYSTTSQQGAMNGKENPLSFLWSRKIFVFQKEYKILWKLYSKFNKYFQSPVFIISKVYIFRDISASCPIKLPAGPRIQWHN